MYASTMTTNKEHILLKKRIWIKTALNILCIIILFTITAAMVVLVLKYLKDIQETEVLELDVDKYPPVIKKALKNNTVILTAKKSEQLMMSGTKWCGKGNIAVSYNDLGTSREVDTCCRNHDVCPGHVKPGQTAHGLENMGFFDWSSCDCDNKFRSCLKDVNNFISDTVGFGYFNVFGSKCWKKEYPVVGCQKFKYTIYAYDIRDKRRCVEPILDKSSPKIYQWFDNGLYF